MDIGRQKQIANMEQIREVGIVFTVGDEQRWNTICKYAKLLSSEGKTVWLCGHLNKRIKLNYILSHPQAVICHEGTDTQWNGEPKEGVLSQFTQRHYDLLVDLTEEPDFFGKYVALKTLADLKATYVDTTRPSDSEQEQIFDLSIMGHEPMEAANFLESLDEYLSQIKK